MLANKGEVMIKLENNYSATSNKIIDSGKNCQLLSKPTGNHLMETKVKTYICYYFHSTVQQETTYNKTKPKNIKIKGRGRPNGSRIHKRLRQGYKPPTRKSYTYILLGRTTSNPKCSCQYKEEHLHGSQCW